MTSALADRAADALPPRYADAIVAAPETTDEPLAARPPAFDSLLIVVAVIGGYFLIKRFLPEIDLQRLLEDVSNTLGAWTYLLVGAFAFLETGAFVGLVAPGETVVILGGAVAGQGETSIVADDRDRVDVGVGRATR